MKANSRGGKRCNTERLKVPLDEVGLFLQRELMSLIAMVIQSDTEIKVGTGGGERRARGQSDALG